MSADQAIAAVMTDPQTRERGAPSCEVREIALPELEPDSALLEVTFSEVCGTDVYLREGRLAGVPYPIIPGHVSVGVLGKIRGTMLDVYGDALSEGDRVTFLDVHETCHRCWHCLVGKSSTRCPKRKVYGITYGVQDGLTGGWASHLYLKPGVHCIPLGDVPSERYMGGGCSLPTAIHAVERADINFGDTVLILGAGPVGLSAIAFARLRGAFQVLCIGAPQHRLDSAVQMGATDVLDFTNATEEERCAWVLDRTRQRGADVTIECTGAPVAVPQSMRFTRDAGRVVVVGQYTDHGEVPFNPHLDLNKKHLDIRGCWGSDYSHFHRAIDVLRTEPGGAVWDRLSLSRHTLSEVDLAMDAVASGDTIKALITPIV